MQGISSYYRGPFRPSVPAVAGVAGLCLRLAATACSLAPPLVAAGGRHWGAAAQARHLAFYLAHVAGGLPQRRVAREMGCHVSSVAYGIRRIEEGREQGAFNALVGDLERHLYTLTDGRLA